MSDQPHGTNGTGARTNGNGHEYFSEDNKSEAQRLAIVVPQARRRVCQNTKIPESARMFFCWLTDMSLLPGVNSRRGVVKFSNGYLAQRFDVSDKTIQNWKLWIASTGEVWLTEKHMKNSFPQTVYNITAIVGQATLPMDVDSNDGSLPEDEIFSSNRRRQTGSKRERTSGKFACRVHGVSGCPICRQKTPPPCRARSVAGDFAKSGRKRHRWKNFAVLHGNRLPPTTANGCRRGRQMVAVGHGNQLPTIERLKV